MSWQLIVKIESLMTGMYGRVKMRDGERICNWSVVVVQRGHRIVEIMRYDTENRFLDVNYTAFNSITWQGNASHMPASSTPYFRCMYWMHCLQFRRFSFQTAYSWIQTHTHTHTHRDRFNSHFPGKPCPFNFPFPFIPVLCNAFSWDCQIFSYHL